MKKLHMVLIVASTLLAQQAFADDGIAAKPCSSIANACLSAGYSSTDTAGKQIWHDCMKPVIMGKAVQGITVDAATVKACQTAKVQEYKDELNDLQNAMKSSS